jgi:hypothetical protein
MKRIEIMISRALDEEFIELIEANDLNHFTAISPAMGKGFSSPKLGNEIWPQTNKLYIFYIGDKKANDLAKIVMKLRKEFPSEGLGAFQTEAQCLAGCSEMID